MSYIEHGSRIFSAVNNALSWSRSDGRLKEYDSCSDIRAWSPNELENSRYFRELTETASSPANKVIPFSVVIDNLIELGTQTENELSNVRRELERYKSLDLSLEQATQLRNAELNDEQDDPTPFFLHSLSGTKSLSKCSVIKNDRATSPDLHICDSENTVDPPISIENSNIGIQVCPEHVPDTEQNVKESVNRSSICDFIDVSTEEILNYESRPRRSRSRGSISSCNETSTFGSEIDKSSVSSEDLTDITQGKLIIEKDSMIISLKIDLKAKEMEIAELQSENKILQSRIHGMGTKMNFLQGNLKLSQEKLAGMGDLQCCELKDLKYELDHNRNEIKVLQKCIIEQKQELNALIQKEQTVRKERDALASQVDEMAKSVEDFDKVSKALDELKNIQRERDELLEEKKRLCDYLNDDNQIIYDLVHMCNNMARKSEKTKVMMEAAMDELRAEIAEKNTKINQCEEQLINSGKESADIIVNLRNSLKCTTELRQVHDESGGSLDLNQDLRTQTKMVLSDVSKLVHENMEYCNERTSMIQEIQSLKQQIDIQSQSSPEFRMTGSRTSPDLEINNIKYSDYDFQSQDSIDIKGSYTIMKFEDLQDLENQIQQVIEQVASISQDNKHYKIDNRILHEACLALKHFQLNVKHFQGLPRQLQLLNIVVKDAREATRGLVTEEDEFSEYMTPRSVDDFDEPIDHCTDFSQFVKHFQESIENITMLTEIIKGSGDAQHKLVQKLQLKIKEIENLQLEIGIKKESFNEIEESYKRKYSENIIHLTELLNETEHNLKHKSDEMNELQMLLDEYKLKIESSENDNLLLRQEIKSVTNDRNRVRQECDKCEEQISQLSLKIIEMEGIVDSMEQLKKKLEDSNTRNKILLEDNQELRELVGNSNSTLGETNKKIDELSKDVKIKGHILQEREQEIALMNKRFEELIHENEALSMSVEEMRDANEKFQKNIIESQSSVNFEELNKLQSEICNWDFEKDELKQRLEELEQDLEKRELSYKLLEEDLSNTLDANETLKVLIDKQQVTNETLAQELKKKSASKEQLNNDITNLLSGISSLKQKLTKSKLLKTKVKGDVCKEDHDRLTYKYRSLQTEFDEQTEILRFKEMELQDMTKKWHNNLKVIKDLTRKGAKLENNNKQQSSYNSCENLELNTQRQDLQYSNLVNEIENKKAAEIQTLHDQIDVLLNEKKDLLTKIKEKDRQYNISLEEMKRKFDRSKHELHRQHNISVKRLEARYDEIAANEGSSIFDPNKWLLGLTEKERQELHNRLCANDGEVVICSRNIRQDDVNKYQHEDLGEKTQNDKLMMKFHNEILQYKEANRSRNQSVRSNARSYADPYLMDTDKDIDDTLSDISHSNVIMHGLRTSSKENLRNKKKQSFLHECSMRYSVKYDET